MTKRFCSDCETFHDGSCSASALARAGKGGKKRKGGDSTESRRDTLRPGFSETSPLTADVPAEASNFECGPMTISSPHSRNRAVPLKRADGSPLMAGDLAIGQEIHFDPKTGIAVATESVADGQSMTVDLGAKTATPGDTYWLDRYNALIAQIEAEKQANLDRVHKHRAAKLGLSVSEYRARKDSK